MIIDGKQLSAKLKEQMAEQVVELKEKYSRVPSLAVILVGENPASQSYVRGKIKACEVCGFESILITMPDTVSQADLLAEIERLNADPKVFPDAKKIEQLNYMDTIEMAYSGAQIIHPKTIKPLQQKNIPLYVRPFGNKSAMGSVITSDVERAYEPIMIQKSNQVLLRLNSRDLSFVLEEKFATVFTTFDSHRIRINLVHNSAVDLHIAVDASWHIDEAISELIADGFDVEKQEDVVLVTIRYYNDELYRKYAFDERIIIKPVSSPCAPA